jgi:hypothetical protein
MKVTKSGEEIFAKKVILTTGTFLDGLIHIGQNQQKAGRFGEMSAIKLADSIKEFDLQIDINYQTASYQFLQDLYRDKSDEVKQLKKYLENKNIQYETLDSIKSKIKR